MKGDITLKILEKIDKVTTTHVDLIGAILESGYGASFQKINRSLEKRAVMRAKATQGKEERYAEYARYYKMLGHIKKDGLIEEDRMGEKKILRITQKGITKLAHLRARKSNALPQNSYEQEESDTAVIVAFDIPEKQRPKRDWVRAVLKNLGFVMVQHSVWLGNKKIPRKFLADIRNMGIASSIEIFQVTKSGSLKRLSDSPKEIVY